MSALPAAVAEMDWATERRREQRFRPGKKVLADFVEGVLCVFGWGKRHTAKDIIDFSEGGMKLVSQEALEPGSVVLIELKTEEPQERFEAYAEVRWSAKAHSSSSTFLAGLEYFSISARQIEDVRRLCQRLKTRPADESSPHS